MYLLELAKFMYQLYHRNLPKKFYVSLSKLTEIHNHNTRNTKLFYSSYFIPFYTSYRNIFYTSYTVLIKMLVKIYFPVEVL